MLNVNIEKILPVTEARDSLNKIIDEVDGSDELYVITKNGKPTAIVVGVHHLEKLTGIKHEEIMPDTDLDKTDIMSEPKEEAPVTPPVAKDDDVKDASPWAFSDSSQINTDTKATSAETTEKTSSGFDLGSSPTNGAQANPLSSSTPNPTPATATPAVTTPTTPASPTTSTSSQPAPDSTAVASNVDDIEDIFGPMEETTPTPATSTPASPAAPTSTPTPTAAPSTTTPATPMAPAPTTPTTNNQSTPPAAQI